MFMQAEDGSVSFGEFLFAESVTWERDEHSLRRFYQCQVRVRPF